MGRSPCFEKVGLKKGTWTPEEDQKLLTYIKLHGHGNWRALPAKAGLRRCGKSCRLRWTNYLRPDIKRGKFSLQEEQTIIQLHALLGNRWSIIASHLSKRTDNEIKNYWNTHLKKKLTKMGIDPSTHKLKKNVLDSSENKETANLSHMAQWESARLEAEARLARESKLISTSTYQSKTTFPPPCLDILTAWQGTNGFFNSNESLQSPTSILHFSHNMLTISSSNAASFSDKLAFPAIDIVDNNLKTYGAAGMTKENVPNYCKCSEKRKKRNDDQVVLEVGSRMQLNGMEYPTGDIAAYLADPSWDQNFADGFASLFSDNIGDGYNSTNPTGPSTSNFVSSSCGGDIQEN